MVGQNSSEEISPMLRKVSTKKASLVNAAPTLIELTLTQRKDSDKSG